MGGIRNGKQRHHSRRGYGLLSTPTYAGFDQAALDREYSPSSCIDDINVFLDDYATLSRAAKDRAVANDTCRPDLRYGIEPAQSLDLFLPNTDTPAPLQLFVHGGYWQLLSKEQSSFAATMFVEQGFAFAALNYTLAPHKRLTGIVEEIEHAIAWLYTHAGELGLDATRIHVSGSSAGAHLATMLLSTDWGKYRVPHDVVKGVCAVSGVFDLEPVQLTYVNEQVGMDVDEALAMSPIRQKPINTCPVILAYGDTETSEFKRQTDDYRSYLHSSGLPVEFAEIAGRNHFDVILDLTESHSWLASRILDQMRGPSEPGDQ